jgi:malonyl-CoA/methylmalonyl-CoA synthetase
VVLLCLAVRLLSNDYVDKQVLTSVLGPHITLKEATHNAKTVRAHSIITSNKYVQLAQGLQQQISSKMRIFSVVCSTPVLRSPLLDLDSVTITSGRTLDQNKPALVIFTSGSTGPPKGVAIRRYNLYALARYVVNSLRIDRNTTIVQFLPTHHATGLLFNTLPALVGGGCVVFSQGAFDAAKVWERFREGGLPSFSAVPTVYVRLLRHWETVLSKLPQEEMDSYRAAVSAIVSFHSSTSALPREVGLKWKELVGKAITERYGGSEAGGVYSNVIGEPVVPGSVGKRIRLTESKLSSGDHGEVLVRGPFLFMKWVDNLQTAWNLISSRSYQEVNLTRSFILDTCSIQRRLGDRSTRMAFT